MGLRHIPIKSSSDIVEEAHRLTQASEPFAWVTIIGSEGSSARHLGASIMLRKKATGKSLSIAEQEISETD